MGWLIVGHVVAFHLMVWALGWCVYQGHGPDLLGPGLQNSGLCLNEELIASVFRPRNVKAHIHILGLFKMGHATSPTSKTMTPLTIRFSFPLTRLIIDIVCFKLHKSSPI